VPDILIASDAEWVVEDLVAALVSPDVSVRSVSRGSEVRTSLDPVPDLVVLDLQIGNMGGMATCLDLRLEESAGRLPHVPVLMLLDRRPDVFLARRSGADGWLLKPIDPIRTRRATEALLAGGRYEDPTGEPFDVAAAPASG
jgi:DNA-binding response OmpR family regulator